MKRFALALVPLTFLVVGCGAAEDYDPNTDPGEVYPTSVPDGLGGTVDCIIYDDNKYDQGGISCDFPDPVPTVGVTP